MSTSCQPTHSSETTTRKKKVKSRIQELTILLCCSPRSEHPDSQGVSDRYYKIGSSKSQHEASLSLSLTLPLFFSLTLFLFPCSHSKPPPPPTFPITDRLAKSLPRAWSDSLDSTHAGRNLCADVIESCQHVKKRE